jgi:hypothetical protein
MQTYTRDDTVHGIDYVLRSAAEDAITILRERLKTAEAELSIASAERDHYRRQSERLKQERDARPAWIPVTETMPETLVPVIVYGILEGEWEHDRHEAFRRHIGSRDPWRSPRMEHDENLRFREVTHWMPMPPAPVPSVNEVNPVQPDAPDAAPLDTTQPFVFLDEASIPWMVNENWLYRWNNQWITSRELVDGELELMAAKRLPPERAALYGWLPTKPAASPAAPPHPPASTDDTPHSSAPESAPVV